MMEHFLQLSDYVHWQVFTNMPVLLLGLLICISHEVHLGTLVPPLEMKVVLQFCDSTGPES